MNKILKRILSNNIGEKPGVHVKLHNNIVKLNLQK